MKHKYLYLSISVSGASVLAIEILGTRIIGPYYGVNLFLWSALIGVTLAALSVGYVIGGTWADRKPAFSRLAWILVAAGIWIALLPLMKGPVAAAARPVGHRAALLIASFVLFFPPLAVLGMVSPYALRLRARTVGEIGRSAGDLYAISTLASVAAALLTGFVLIPSFGVSGLTAAIGIVLAATGILGLTAAAERRPGIERGNV
jgi:predicted membrane-bound spermidine synthase